MDKLGEAGQFTLFAPTNAAFEQMGIQNLERLQDNKAVLQGAKNSKDGNVKQMLEAEVFLTRQFTRGRFHTQPCITLN
uniref:FAS1 domain-containing protein n=1 Tax=Knipowitschia caucasica TaxID=637954 RepID=A0AAV2J9R8_KNICA